MLQLAPGATKYVNKYSLNGQEFGQTLGDSEGQESLVFCTSWGCKELEMT